MAEKQTEYVPVLMTPRERQELESLAKASGRSKGGVFRRLLQLASRQDVREYLGITTQPAAQDETKPD